MKIIVFKNHLNINMYLYEDVLNAIIEKDEKKTQLLTALFELFEHPDEIFLFDYSGNLTQIAYKYIKFYKDCVLFGIVDMMNITEQKVIDFYRFDWEEKVLDNGKEIYRFDFERRGQLIRESHKGNK